MTQILRRPSLLGSPDGGFYNVETLLMGGLDPATVKPLEHWQTYIHESQHWLQHQGTSLGMFLSLLKYLRDRSVFTWLSKLQPTELKNCFVARAAGVPIVQFDNAFNLAQVSSGDSHDLDTMRQVLADIELTRDMFYENSFQIQQWYRPITESIGLAMRDAKDLCEKALGCTTKPQNSQPKFTGDCRIPRTQLPTGGYLSTHALLENAAVAHELMFLQSSGAPEHLVGERVKKVLGTSYMSALTLFCCATGFGIKSSMQGKVSRVLGTFLLLVDIALNPVLPPSERILAQWESLNLQELLPTSRFVACLNACAEKKLLVKDLHDNASLRSFVDEVCKLSRLSSVSLGDTTCLPAKPWEGFANFFAISHKTPPPQTISDLEKRHPFEYICWNYENAMRLRQNNFGLVVLNGMHGGTSSFFGTEGEETAIQSFGPSEEWLIPPPVSINGQVYFHPFVHQKFGGWLVRAMASDYLVHDLAFQGGQPNTSLMPMDSSYSASWSAKVREQFGEAPW